jgi:hypothetical protein
MLYYNKPENRQDLTCLSPRPFGRISLRGKFRRPVMKSTSLTLMAALLGPVFLLTGTAGAESGKEDLTKVYEAGRQAFHRGDLARAKTAFTRVLQAKPDFDLAKIYMAQIRHAEAQWEARPRSQKIAEKAQVRKVALTGVTLADALEVVRRELEKAGGGEAAGRIALITQLPPEVLERPVSLTVAELPMMDFVEAVGFAGDVRIAWHAEGLSVTPSGGMADRPDPRAAEAAVQRIKTNAAARIIPHLKMEELPASEAWARLLPWTGPAGVPLIVVRQPSPEMKVTLDLRQIPLSEAIRSVAMVCAQEVTWHPWGAGVSVKPAVAAAAPSRDNR